MKPWQHSDGVDVMVFLSTLASVVFLPDLVFQCNSLLQKGNGDC